MLRAGPVMPFGVTRPKWVNAKLTDAIYIFYMIRPANIYRSLFVPQVHDFVRPEILEQILNRVVTKATTQVSHYLGEWTAGRIAGFLND